MSTQLLLPDHAQDTVTAPELSALGKRIELLRIERGLSKQHLARRAGTSRQQLWRVMTGKSDLTSSLRVRLADVLGVDAAALATTTAGHLAGAYVLASDPSAPAPLAPPTLEQYVSSTAAIERTLRTLPDTDAGWRLKRLVLNCIEDVAHEAGLRLDQEYFALRARVTNRERD